MGHADYLWGLLQPLGPYREKGVYSGGELDSVGQALDGVGQELELLEREAFLDTAESFGLDRIESLLARPPVTESIQGRQMALAALLRIGGDSFTLDAINDNLKGCGLNAVVSETVDPGVVQVTFPDVPGIPKWFKELRGIIEDILPCHLEIDYVFWYITWALIESKYRTWGAIEEKHYTWEELESQVR